jgi:hypothetical protein
MAGDVCAGTWQREWTICPAKPGSYNGSDALEIVRAEKTPEDDDSLNSEQFGRVGIVFLNPCKGPVSAFSAVCRVTLPAAEARTSSCPLSVKER